ncbi:MAG: HD domain-containing protein [Thermodesulfobacteriota bacterium]
MSKTLCPGQSTMFWTDRDVFEIPCGSCGADVEFFRDDAKRRCGKCGNIVYNPKLNLGCATWCEHAKECLGYDPKEKYGDAEQGQEALVDRLIGEMKRTFGKDEERIAHALRVLENAKAILKETPGADPKVVFAAALLHDIGIQEAERKHGSNAGRFQEMEGPAIAEPIMKGLKLDPATIDHVVKIIANHHSARDIDTIEFRILWDADVIVNIPDEHADKTGEDMARFIEKVLHTDAGKKIARQKYLSA